MLGDSTIVILGFCCLLVVIASLAGGWLPLLVHLTHARLQIAISFVAGLMLGLALLHFLPDAAEQLHSLDRTVGWALAGFLVMFFLQRFLHYHTHDVPEEAAEADGSRADVEDHHGHAHQSHDHGYEHSHEHAGQGSHRISWVGAAVGLTLHSLLDGIALAAAISVGTQEGGRLIGLGTGVSSHPAQAV